MIAAMATSREWPDRIRAAVSTLRAACLGAVLLTIITLPAEARGGHGFEGHGFGHGFGSHGMHGTEFAGGRHGNDSYAKAASEERDRLLDTQIKSICRGC